ncbi:sugar-binding transcriptional regulator [Streptomyces sporangiiformans]|jgi:DNA-binding transcriptional regulator LsrR (DeoR family)|uniref:Sugar-binding transcriptional regulator n=1 Tax=Streptomyces sporangiiformans TaxID=2315329 RepID=A0A505DL94_9ACTN|nr:sugar-binding transcriptional regulator [Streptomyces sporangiiformans]TPQ19201.1 sugar-binding transcriptional regulator [Streptomyces sporangiiformans]
MPASRERDLLVKAARLYYQDNCSQQEVASALGVSRSNVSRILAAAREQGIVEIRINDPAGREVDLEEEVLRTFKLTACRVAAVRSDEEVLPKVGELAADWLLDMARPGDGISLSWGRTLQAMVRAVHSDRAIPVEVLPLVGGLSSVASEIMGEELVRDLADRLGATFRRLHAPALLEAKASRDTLMAEPSISSVLEAGRKSSLAFVGVGAAGVGSSEALIDSLRLSRRDRAAFEKAKPVGDVCARYFDEDGNPVRGAVEDRVLAVSLDDLRRIRTVVGLAAGAEKARGVLGALRGRYLDALVCDEPLAEALLAQSA